MLGCFVASFLQLVFVFVGIVVRADTKLTVPVLAVRGGPLTTLNDGDVWQNPFRQDLVLVEELVPLSSSIRPLQLVSWTATETQS